MMPIVGASEDFLLAVIADLLAGGNGDIAGAAPAAGDSIKRIAILEPTWESGSEGDEAAYAKLYEVIVGAALPGKPPSSEVILRAIVEHLT